MRSAKDRAVTSFVVGFGANLGPKEATLSQALRRLGEHVTVVARSSLYETAPLGPPQPAYLNAAALVHAPPHPERLLAVVLSIERELGRERRERWGPRVIDLDILWGDGVHVESNTLCVPHPALRERAFALLPLLELVPDASDPATGERYSVASARAGTAGILAVRPWVLGS